MKIAICSSMAFAKEMIEIKKELEKMKHQVVLPFGTEKYLENRELQKRASDWGSSEGANLKIHSDLIRRHYNEIKNSDAVLIVNKDKKGIKNYIGGNTFLEMGFAYILNKKIFVLNSLPEEVKIFYQELLAMQPIILNGGLSLIK